MIINAEYFYGGGPELEKISRPGLTIPGIEKAIRNGEGQGNKVVGNEIGHIQTLDKLEIEIHGNPE